jgi:hypothetical protein
MGEVPVVICSPRLLRVVSATIARCRQVTTIDLRAQNGELSAELDDGWSTTRLLLPA